LALPTADQLVEAWVFTSPRNRLRGEPDRAEVEAVVRDALACAPAPEDEPAALLYALARHQGAYPIGGRTQLVVMLVHAQAQAVGLTLDMTANAINELRLAIPWQRVPFSKVRDILRPHLAPIETPQA